MQSTPAAPPFASVSVRFHHSQHSERTVFVHFTAPNLRVNNIENACRRVADRNQPQDWIENIKSLHHGIFVIQFQKVKDAHSLAGAGRSLVIRHQRHRHHRSLARLYPAQSPKVYITSVMCEGPNAVHEDAILHSLASILPPANATHLRLEDQPSGPSSDRRHWLVAFRKCPRWLHFSVPIQKRDNCWTSMHFDPVSATNACLVCKTGHAAWDCGSFRSVTAEELGASTDDPRILDNMPRISYKQRRRFGSFSQYLRSSNSLGASR